MVPPGTRDEVELAHGDAVEDVAAAAACERRAGHLSSGTPAVRSRTKVTEVQTLALSVRRERRRAQEAEQPRRVDARIVVDEHQPQHRRAAS